MSEHSLSLGPSHSADGTEPTYHTQFAYLRHRRLLNMQHETNEPGRFGLLLVGHGSREAESQRGFFQLAAGIADRLAPVPVEPCFLELAEPSIAEGVGGLVQRGAGRIGVLPMLLLAAAHVRRDIPAAVHAAVERFPEVDAILLDHLGQSELVARRSEQCFHEAIAERRFIDSSDTELLIVGRGTSDPRAIDEMYAFVARRGAMAPAAIVQTCFLAMAEPKFEATIEQIAQRSLGRVVVQPHLLFQGELFGRVEDCVKSVAQQRPEVDWVVTQPLGPSTLLIDAAVEIATHRLSR
jgi:sirohydrochlorin cobaltochelatase